MNDRRTFLRGLFASTATIVVAPESALEALDAVTHQRQRSYFDAPSELSTVDDLRWMAWWSAGFISWAANDRDSVWRPA